MNPHLRAIFFDAGGTLIHLDAAWLLSVLADHGLGRTPEQFRAADLAARRAVLAWLASPAAGGELARWQVYARALVDALGCSPDQEAGLRAAVRTRHAAALLWSYAWPGTAAALAELRAAGLTLGVVSNADGRVETFLAHAGLRAHLDFVVDSQLLGFEKPDPRIFHAACERAGVAPAEAVHVGDVYEVDVLGARAAGVTPILFDPDDLQPAADCLRIRSIAELPQLLLAGVTP